MIWIWTLCAGHQISFILFIFFFKCTVTVVVTKWYSSAPVIVRIEVFRIFDGLSEPLNMESTFIFGWTKHGFPLQNEVMSLLWMFCAILYALKWIESQVHNYSFGTDTIAYFEVTYHEGCHTLNDLMLSNFLCHTFFQWDMFPLVLKVLYFTLSVSSVKSTLILSFLSVCLSNAFIVSRLKSSDTYCMQNVWFEVSPLSLSRCISFGAVQFGNNSESPGSRPDIKHLPDGVAYCIFWLVLNAKALRRDSYVV